MKKLLVLTLAVVLTLSLTVVASAATFDPYVGGRITWVYVDHEDLKDDPVSYGFSGIKLLLKGKVSDEATGTWGALGAKIDGWADKSGGERGSELGTSSIYEFGINNIGGSNFNIWYSNFENEKGNRGQGKIYGINPLQTHDDCMFDKDLKNVIGIDYVSDNIVVNFGYVPDKVDYIYNKANDEYIPVENDKNEMSIAATFNFDGGDIHVGNWQAPNGDSETNVGGSFKLGFGTIKADYIGYSPDQGDSSSIIQAGVSFDALKFDITVAVDNKYVFKKDGGTFYQIRYMPIDNLTLCYRAGQAKDEVNEDDNFTNFYVGYKYGVIESRIGLATYGEDNKALGYEKEDVVYASCYVSFW